MSKPSVQEQRWLSAVDDGVFGVWDLDPASELVHYSPEWKRRLGFTEHHAADSTWAWRCRVHPDDLTPMIVSMRAHLDGSTPNYAAQFRLRINGSGYRTVLSRGRVVARDAEGTATRMVGTMVDLTDRPVAVAMHGLPASGPSERRQLRRLPFHAVLGAARPGGSLGLVAAGAHDPAAVAAENRRLIDLVDELLETALRDASASPQQGWARSDDPGGRLPGATKRKV